MVQGQNKTQGTNQRMIVLEMLLTEQVYSHLLVREVLYKYNYLTQQEKAFIKRLYEGTLERQIELDYVIGQYSSVKTGKMKKVIRALLRMSVYQILYMDAVPDAAACNEAVKLAQKKGILLAERLCEWCSQKHCTQQGQSGIHKPVCQVFYARVDCGHVDSAAWGGDDRGCAGGAFKRASCDNSFPRSAGSSYGNGSAGSAAGAYCTGRDDGTASVSLLCIQRIRDR